MPLSAHSVGAPTSCCGVARYGQTDTPDGVGSLLLAIGGLSRLFEGPSALATSAAAALLLFVLLMVVVFARVDWWRKVREAYDRVRHRPFAAE